MHCAFNSSIAPHLAPCAPRFAFNSPVVPRFALCALRYASCMLSLALALHPILDLKYESH